MNKPETHIIASAIRDAHTFTVQDLSEMTGLGTDIIRIWIFQNLISTTPVVYVHKLNECACGDERLVFKKTLGAYTHIETLLSYPDDDPHVSLEWSFFLSSVEAEREGLASGCRNGSSEAALEHADIKARFARQIVSALQNNEVQVPEQIMQELEKFEEDIQKHQP